MKKKAPIDPVFWAPALVFCLLWLHGSILGLSDDEAYYWWLAQNPSLGYAYHPPGVAWMIGAFESVFRFFYDHPSSAWVRFPAALTSSVCLFLALDFIARSTPSRRFDGWLASGILVSFSGFFGLSWMMVPDIPLFLGITLLFYCSYFVSQERLVKKNQLSFTVLRWGLFVGAFFVLISKYSGVLAVGSAGLSILFFSEKSKRWSLLGWLVAGACLGALPFLIWNMQHEWLSILYQIRERHGGSVSWSRYLRFWMIQVLFAGPLSFAFLWVYLRRGWREFQDLKKTTIFFPIQEKMSFSFFALIWSFPPFLVFGTQPLFSDFKPHWAFVIWWPILILAAREISLKKATGLKVFRRLLTWQIAQAGLIMFVIFVGCHIPFLSIYGRLSGKSVQTVLDVTNDFYGWKQLPSYLKESEASLDVHPIMKKPVVLASRYQTASQAAFQLSQNYLVSLVPRGRKDLDEWPITRAVDSQGPEWPSLKEPVFYVTDHRYTEGPQFQNAECVALPQKKIYRMGFYSKWIQLWSCRPNS